MESIDNKTVAEIVTTNIKTADVFKRNGIDFCCGGHVSVQEICSKKGIDYSRLKEEILNVGKTRSITHDYNSWEIDFLTDYIVNTHHKYVIGAMPIIAEYAEKVAAVHGHHYSEIIEIKNLFQQICLELDSHMQKEEQLVFPIIKEIAKEKNDRITGFISSSRKIKDPIHMMETEHTHVGDLIKRIGELSNNFNPPNDACNTFRALYAGLEEFQNDLFQHIHLENNILFPKAIKFEQELH